MAVLACRVLAIVALISVIQASAFLLPLFYNAFHPGGGMESPIGFFPLEAWLTLVYISPLMLLLVLAVFLWARAEFVAAKMVGARDENLAPIPADQNAQTLAFSVLGAYVLTLGLPRLAQLLVHSWNVGSQATTLHQDWTGFAPNLIYTVAELALGLWLLFGAHGLVALLFDLRRLGRDSASVRQEDDEDSVSVRPEN